MKPDLNSCIFVLTFFALILYPFLLRPVRSSVSVKYWCSNQHCRAKIPRFLASFDRWSGSKGGKPHRPVRISVAWRTAVTHTATASRKTRGRRQPTARSEILSEAFAKFTKNENFPLVQLSRQNGRLRCRANLTSKHKDTYSSNFLAEIVSYTLTYVMNFDTGMPLNVLLCVHGFLS